MNVVMTKTTIVTIESKDNDKKIVATQKRMLQHNKELKAEISVATTNPCYWEKLCRDDKDKYFRYRN